MDSERTIERARQAAAAYFERNAEVSACEFIRAGNEHSLVSAFAAVMLEPDPRQFDLRDDPEKPHAFIQWKNTDLCMDFYCECGEHNHFDGYFANVVKCARCSQEWEMPVNVFPRKRCSETYEGHSAKLMEGDDGD